MQCIKNLAFKIFYCYLPELTKNAAKTKTVKIRNFIFSVFLSVKIKYDWDALVGSMDLKYLSKCIIKCANTDQAVQAC